MVVIPNLRFVLDLVLIFCNVELVYLIKFMGCDFAPVDDQPLSEEGVEFVGEDVILDGEVAWGFLNHLFLN